MDTWIRPGWVLVTMLFFAFQANAQHYRTNDTDSDAPSTTISFDGCGSDAHRASRLANDPAASARHHAFEWQILQDSRRGTGSSGSRSAVLTVPVVVHIVHDNGVENIPVQQVSTAIQQLNLAFSNSGPYAVASGNDIEIDFCLAQRDPQGNATTGINRVQSPLTVFTRETQDAQLKSLSQWPTEDYLNVWIVRDVISSTAGSKVAGYATFPFMHGNPDDGIVIEFNYFGTTPNSNKAFVHEVGHYLGLYHTFEGGCKNDDCLADGDRVCDTPPDGSTAAVTGYVNSCSSDADDTNTQNPFRPIGLGGQGDQPDPYDNYMDYGALTVLSRFTAGQKDRMRSHLQQFRASLLGNLACESPCLTNVIADFSASADTVVIGTTVSFSNNSQGASSFEWLVNGTAFSTTTNASQTFNTPGQYIIRLDAGNGQTGCGDVFEKRIVVECDAQADFSLSQNQVLPGESFTVTSTAQNANQVQWLFNGAAFGTAPTVTTQIAQAGGVGIQLVASSAQCNDSSRIQFLDVSRCGTEMHTLNWVFGDSAAFRLGTDTIIPTPATGAGTFEGVASISDENGDLLFYCNGPTVYDRANFPMTNGQGLIGSKSASQGVVAIPYPGQPMKYFLFTSDAVENTFFNGLRYSVIDMTANNGFGDVIPTQKNIMLGFFKCEMVAAVQHDNGRDFWLITHEAFNNNFNSFLISPTGINTIPVVTTIGPSMMVPTGGMKVSPNREKVAISMNEIGVRSLAVLDFDATTGKFANPFLVPINPTQQVYGVEWSPDNSRVFFTTLYDLFQIDMTQPTPQDIINSNTLIYTSPALDVLSLQRASNGKIYVSMGQFDKLHVIEEPNALGNAVGFQYQGYDLNGSLGFWGLPNFYVGMGPEIDFVDLTGTDEACEGSDNNLYVATKENPGQSIAWDYVGPVVLKPSPFDSLMEVEFTGSGTAAVIAERSSSCGVSRDTQWVNLLAAPISNLVEDTMVCPGTLFPLTGNNDPAVTSQWNTGASTSTIFPSQTGTYSVALQNADGCVTEDSMELGILAPGPILVDLGSDTAVCQGSVVVLDADKGNGFTYQWQNGSQLPFLTTTSAGMYTVEVADQCGNIGRDTVMVRDTNVVFLNLGPDEEICGPKLITVGADYSRVVWEDGSTDGDRTVTQPGTYSVEVTSVQGCVGRDTINFLPCTAVGIDPAIGDLALDVYPNPSNGISRIRLDGIATLAAPLLEIVDGQGRLVLSRRIDAVELNRGYEVDLSSLANGIYSVQVHLDETVVNGRIHLQR